MFKVIMSLYVYEKAFSDYALSSLTCARHLADKELTQRQAGPNV